MSHHRLWHQNDNLSLLIVIAACLLMPTCLTGCGSRGLVDVPAATPDAVSLAPQDWRIFYSDQLPEHPLPSTVGAWSIPIPTNPGHLNYVQTPYRASGAHNKLTITFRVDSSPDAVYNGKVDPDAWNPATFHVFLERRNDDMTNEYYRWWATNGRYVMGSADNSIVTIEVPLTSENWTSVLGHHSEKEFNATMNDMGWVGVTFGGSNYFGHGMNMLSGCATFTLIDYRIE